MTTTPTISTTLPSMTITSSLSNYSSVSTGSSIASSTVHTSERGALTTGPYLHSYFSQIPSIESPPVMPDEQQLPTQPDQRQYVYPEDSDDSQNSRDEMDVGNEGCPHQQLQALAREVEGYEVELRTLMEFQRNQLAKIEELARNSPELRPRLEKVIREFFSRESHDYHRRHERKQQQHRDRSQSNHGPHNDNRGDVTMTPDNHHHHHHSSSMIPQSSLPLPPIMVPTHHHHSNSIHQINYPMEVVVHSSTVGPIGSSHASESRLASPLSSGTSGDRPFPTTPSDPKKQSSHFHQRERDRERDRDREREHERERERDRESGNNEHHGQSQSESDSYRADSQH